MPLPFGDLLPTLGGETPRRFFFSVRLASCIGDSYDTARTATPAVHDAPSGEEAKD